MPTPAEKLAELEPAYRRATFKVICHVVFIVVCCVAAIIIRGMMRLPPALLTTVFVVALLVFGNDFIRFIVLRYRVQRLRLEVEDSA